MNILITGPRGFVGKKLMDFIPGAVGAPSLQNITEDALKALLDETRPDLIIHTAAVSDMPACDKDPQGSYIANVILPEMLARNKGTAKLVAFSSDQVYNGMKDPGPYTEEEICPANTYARQKAEMEARVLAADPDAVLLRAEWMFDYVAPKGNYIRNMLAETGPILCSSAQFRGVTYVKEVCESMAAVAKLPGGAYNFGSETELSMLELNRAFLEMTGRTNPLVDTGRTGSLWMNCAKARSGGVEFSSSVEAVRRCLRDYNLI